MLRANIGSKSAILLLRGPVDPKFQVEGVAPTNHSPSHKTRLNDLSYDTKIWTDFSSVLSQCTRLTDGRTDRGTGSFLLTRPACIQCNAVKTVQKLSVFLLCVCLNQGSTNHNRCTDLLLLNSDHKPETRPV